MGAGATQRKDGNDAEITRHSNCRNTPIEVFEGRYPFRTLEYRLARDFGGPGRYRGGMGSVRTIEVTAPEITLSALFDRAKIPAWGLFGGNPGGLASLRVKRTGDDQFRTFHARSTRCSTTSAVGGCRSSRRIETMESRLRGAVASTR
jgi:N-methylhydantoinase B/oxoprolinase/acetone carboxylase alpha subunit